MRNNPNPSLLASLSEEQQQQLVAWLDLLPLSQVLEKVAAPPPEGFGLKTYPTSLRRFYARHRLSTISDEATLASELLAAVAQSADFDTATASALKQLAFQMASAPAVGHQQFRALSRWILKIRDQQHQAQALALAEKRLALDTQRFRFNAARQALIHFAELAEIAKNQKADNEDKIRAVADLLFQPAPHPGSADIPVGDWSLDIFRWTQKFFCGITRCRDHDNTSAGP